MTGHVESQKENTAMYAAARDAGYVWTGPEQREELERAQAMWIAGREWQRANASAALGVTDDR